MGAFARWSVEAVNLPEHAGNPIHTDEGARAAGFPAALVAGVTVYAYLSHAPAAAWGLDWVANGGAEVRFVAPVLDGERVELDVEPSLDGPAIGEALAAPHLVDAVVDGELRARGAFSRQAPTLPAKDGEELRPDRVEIDESFLDYGARAGDDRELYGALGIAHPVAWPMLANRIFHRQLVSGAWIHVRSLIAHHGAAALGETVDISTRVLERFESRAGPRAIADVRIAAAGRPVATVRHEAVIEAR
jgi:acyl dehydratase